MLMKRILFLTICLLISLIAFAQEAVPEKVELLCGPYIQNPTTTGFTVIWESNMDAVGWVELAPDDGTHFYNADRPKYYDLRGFGNQVMGTIHQVRVDGLEPGTTYRYRIMMKGVKSFKGYGTVEYTQPWGSGVYKKEPYRFTTLKKDYDKVRFDVYNDIHQKDSILNKLMEGAKWKELDFVVFNGDMVSSLSEKEKIREMYLRTAATHLEGRVPLYSLRGNHEFRGKETKAWFEYVDMPEGKPYYTASYGKFFFIFLDTGEDKPDNDIEYGGSMFSEPYLHEEARWLEEVVKSDACKKAAVRIVFAHIPPEKDGWQGNKNVDQLFVPILNKANVDLMISGHLHQWRVDAPQTVSSAKFPVVVNPNCARMEASVSKSSVVINSFNPDGESKYRFVLNYRAK